MNIYFQNEYELEIFDLTILVSAAGTGPAIQRIRLLDELEGTGTSSGNVLNSDILDYYTMLAERGDLQAQV